MDNLQQRLQTVFTKVFPDMPPAKIPSASQDSVETWDSIAAITLINLVEEEFGIEMDFDDASQLTSFAEIMEYLKGRIANPVA